MRLDPKRCLVLGTVATILAVISYTATVQSQTTPIPQPTSTEGLTSVAVSDVQLDHTHAINLQTQDVAKALTILQNDTDFITLESSTGFAGGIENGVPHVHEVHLTRADLLVLIQTGTVTVVSEVALNHTHKFVFVRQLQCPAIFVPPPPGVVVPYAPPYPVAYFYPFPVPVPVPFPVPYPVPGPTQTVTPTPTPTRTVTPSPTPSPTRSPSPTPSVTPSPSPTQTVTPSPSATPSVTPSPSPTQTMTPSPSPSP